MVVFIGREKELAMLNQAYLKGGNSIVVLYGREQIGKTTLIKEFINACKKICAGQNICLLSGERVV